MTKNWNAFKNTTFALASLALIGTLLNGCAKDDAAVASTPVSISTALDSALSYMSDTLPNLGNTVGASARMAPARLRTPTLTNALVNPTLELIYTTNWAGSSIVTSPPGGQVSSPGSEPQYGGATLPTTVNYRDYLKMALDPDFERASDSRTFKPTLFGRLDGLMDILTYMGQTTMPKDSDGLPSVGTHSSPLTIPGMGTVTIDAEVSTPSVSTFYDKHMYLKGSSGGSTLFENLIWLRSSSSSLNMLHVELSSTSLSFNVIQWNRVTGKLAFEHHSGVDDTTASLSHYRYLIEDSSGKQYFYSLEDANGTGQNYMQIALYSPTSTSTQGTVSLRESNSTSNKIILGNLCIGFASGTGVTSDSELSGEASGGTCAGHTDAINTKTGIMGAIFGLVNHTTWQESASGKGFPTSNWSTSGNREAWLTAGDAISTSFNTRSEFISRFAAKPAN
jgi:hypothetical protein